MSDVKSDLRALRKDVDALVSHLSDLVGEEIGEARRGLRGAARKAARTAGHVDDDLRDQIRARPLIACGAAIGAGLLGALPLRR